jgi:hypothetical protein
LRERRSGKARSVPVVEVLPRATPAERYEAAVEVVVEEALTVHAATIKDWVAPRQARLDQIDSVDDEGPELVIVFEERAWIAKLARLTANGLDVELFHILTLT